MATTKEAVVVVLDVGANAGECTTKALKCCEHIIKQKLFHSRKDEIGFVLLGSASSANALNDDMAGYEHISEYLPLSIPDWLTIAKLNAVNDEPKSESGDWLGALIVAMNVIRTEEEVKKKFPYSKIVLFHDFDSKVDADSVDTIVGGISEMGLSLVCVSNNVRYTTDEDGNTKPVFADSPDKSDAQKISEKIALNVIQGCHGKLVNFDAAAEHILGVENRRPWMWHSVLQIGSQIEIQISATIAIKDESKIHFKTDSHIEGTTCWLETENFKDGEKITPTADDLVKGFMIGGTPIAYDESLGVQGNRTEKGMKCLCFSNRSYVLPEYLCGDGVYLVVAKKDAEASGKMLSALVQALASKDMVMVAWKVYQKGGKPKLVALFPNLEREVPCLTMFELFTADQSLYYDFPLLNSKRTEPEAEQLDAIDKLIDAMDLSGDKTQEDPRSTFRKEKLNLKTLPNISVECLLESIAKKVVSGASLDRSTDHLGNLLKNIHSTQLEDIELIGAQLKSLFPLERVKKSDKKDLIRHIGDISSEAPAEPTAGEEVRSDYRKITDVGSVTPAEDFHFLVNRDVKGNDLTDDEIQGNFARLSEQIRSIIADLLFKSMTDQSEKAAKALELYREHAVFHNPFDYNDWIREFKKKLIARKMFDFWEKVIVEKQLGLCWAKDCDYFHDMEDKEPEEFYKLPVATTSGEGVADDPEDVDDLFDNM